MSRIVRNYSKRALKDLQSLDTGIARRIVAKIGVLSDMDNPLTQAKALSGALAGLYRYRVGDYRVIFEIDGRGTIIILNILNIKHRKDVYK